MTQRAIGRPPKFRGPTRVVTVTLPERTLKALSEIDQDRARAIVRATEVATGIGTPATAEDPVDTLAVSPEQAVITVPYSQPLADVPGLSLIKINGARYIVIVEPGTKLPEVEVRITDQIDALGDGADADRLVLLSLLDQLRGFRRSHRATTAQVILIDIDERSGQG